MIKDYLHPLWGKNIRGLSYPDGKANDAFIDALQQDIDAGEKDIYLAKLSSFLDTATGKWLDYWGEWLGLHRNQRNDDDYRSALKKHVLHSRNTIDAIRDAVATYLDTNRNRIYVYEPYRDMFIYNSSNWNTYKFYPSVYYRYAVIDVKIDHPIDGVVAQIINLFRPAGVIFVITNLINVLNDNAPIIDFSVDASNNIVSNDFDYVGFTQNNFVVLSPSLDAVLDNDEEPFTYNKDSWNGGKKYASGTYGSGLLQYASMFQTDQHIHKYPENLVDYSRLGASYLAQLNVNTEYSDGIAKNAEITVTCGTNDNSKNGWGDGIYFDTKPLGESKNVGWHQWYVISGLIKAEFDGAYFTYDINCFPFDLGGEYGNDHDLRSKAIIKVFNGESDNSGDDCNIPKGKWCPFYLAWYNGDDSSNTANPNHSVMYDQTRINVQNSNGIEDAQYKIRDFYARVVDSPSLQEVWIPGSYSTLLYDSPNDTASAEYAKQGLYNSVDTRYAKYTNVKDKPIIGYVDFLSAYSATKFSKLNIDYSGYTGTQSEKLVQSLKPMSVKSLSVYAKVARNSADVTLRVFNYKLALWEIFGTYTLTSTDYTYITHDFYDLSNYFNPVTGLLTFSLLSNNDTDVYIDYYSFTIGSKTDGIYELSTAQFYDNVPLGALTSYSKVGFTDAHYPVTGTAVTDKDSLYRVKTLRTVWDSSRYLQGSGTDFKIGIPDLHQTGKTSSQSDSYMVVTYTYSNGKIAPFASAKLGSINFDLSTAIVNLDRGNQYVCVYQMPLYEDNKQSADLFATLSNQNINIKQVQVLSYFDNEVLMKDVYDYHPNNLYFNNVGWGNDILYVGLDDNNEMYFNIKKSHSNTARVGTYIYPTYDNLDKENYLTVSADVSGRGTFSQAILEANTPSVGYFNLAKYTTRDILVTAKGDSNSCFVILDTYPLKNGHTYTLSFTPIKLGVNPSDTSDISKFTVRVLDTKTTNKQVAFLTDFADDKVHSLTFTIPNDGDNYGVYIYAGNAGSLLAGNSHFTTAYHHLMLEEGSIAHDWSPCPNSVGLELNPNNYFSISNTYSLSTAPGDSNPYTLYFSDFYSKYLATSNNLILDSPTNMVYEKHTKGNNSGWSSNKSWKLTLNKGTYYFIAYLDVDINQDSNDAYAPQLSADKSSGVALLSWGNDDISTKGYLFAKPKGAGDSGWILACFKVPNDNTQVTVRPWCSMLNTGEGRIGYSNIGVYNYNSFVRDVYLDNGFTTPPLLDYKFKNLRVERGVVATKPTDRSVHESLNINTDIAYNNSSYWNNLSSYTKAGIKDPDGDTPVYTTALNKGLSTTGYMLEPNTWYKVSTLAKLPNNTGRRLAWTFYNSGYMSVWDNNTNEYSQDNMRFGGVNLLPNTDFGNISTNQVTISDSQWVLGSAGTATLSVVEETSNKNVGKYSYTILANNNSNTANKDFDILYQFKANTMYTATCKVRLNNDSINTSPKLCIRAWDRVGNYDEVAPSGVNGNRLYYGSPKLYKDRWVTISTTFNTSSWKNASNAHSLGFGIQGPGSVDFYELQLEEGSVSHPYNPAPSDYGLASNQYLVATDSKDWFKTSALFYTGSGFDTHIPELQMLNGSGTLYQGPITLTKVKQNGENLLPSFHQIIESNNYSQRTFNEVWHVIKNNNENAYFQSTTNSDADTLSLKGGSELYINTATTSNINSYLSVGVANSTNKDVSLVISYAGDSQTYVIKANSSRDINRSFIANGNGYSILSFKADGDLTFTNPSMTI